ncbi:uncharacterized protein [Macaca fascicularis]|uniref:uncharacterized protein n=1 Tax=Macaca fascicularis TaxID=9541 RepID=UPI003D15B65A
MCVFQHVELAGEVSRGRHSVQQRACPLQRKRGGGDRGSRAQRLLAQPQEESCRHQEAVRAAGLGADNSRIYRACREPPRPGGRTGNAAPPPGTPPTCGATPASATSPTSSAAATYDDPRVGPPAHTRPRPAPAPFSAPFPAPAPAPSRAPTPAAPPVRLGPARQGPLTLGPGGGAGGAAFPSRARAGRVSIACCAPGLAAALGLLALDADDSRAPKGSLRKFLEQLSGAGKAIGVLTSGGHAQGRCWQELSRLKWGSPIKEWSCKKLIESVGAQRCYLAHSCVICCHQATRPAFSCTSDVATGPQDIPADGCSYAD